ncbi:Early nodulin-93 [Apostasia shenzhenica]|uniref:Early nodulin-93 n=1 Tax=Apostasia shenzhenica TaxID=1088818 RepID=A0A2I0AE88_9ASPA|nr:Early nodulin-93 [Apostasia shenzhenica]
MDLPRGTREVWASKSSSFMAAASPHEPEVLDSKASTTKEAVKRGFKTAIITGSIAAVPTLIGCRIIPWAKANLNYTAQALIISAAAISGFFITADKTILENARGNTIGKQVFMEAVLFGTLSGSVRFQSFKTESEMLVEPSSPVIESKLYYQVLLDGLDGNQMIQFQPLAVAC